MVTRSKNEIFKLKKSMIHTKLPCEPLSVSDAMKDPNWFDVMKQKYQALVDN